MYMLLARSCVQGTRKYIYLYVVMKYLRGSTCVTFELMSLFPAKVKVLTLHMEYAVSVLPNHVDTHTYTMQLFLRRYCKSGLRELTANS